MTPKLAELIAYCQANGIKGSYRTWEDPPYWRASVSTGQIGYSGVADTEDEALDRAASMALGSLLDPQPAKGTREWAEWKARREG